MDELDLLGQFDPVRRGLLKGVAGKFMEAALPKGRRPEKTKITEKLGDKILLHEVENGSWLYPNSSEDPGRATLDLTSFLADGIIRVTADTDAGGGNRKRMLFEGTVPSASQKPESTDPSSKSRT
jgi:hypothetical protein